MARTRKIRKRRLQLRERKRMFGALTKRLRNHLQKKRKEEPSIEVGKGREEWLEVKPRSVEFWSLVLC